jgi:hypothetical protein
MAASVIPSCSSVKREIQKGLLLGIARESAWGLTCSAYALLETSMSESLPTSLRLNDEDREILAKLQRVTGLTVTGAVRLAIREALATRERRGTKRLRTG